MKLRNRIALGVLAIVGVGIVVLGVALSHNAPCGTAPELPADAESMQAVIYRCYGSPDVLLLEDVAKPVPEDDEVLVKVHAAAVNPLDWHYMRGSPYIMRLESGFGAPRITTTGVDFAGTVAAVGSRVTKFKPGDEVFGGRTGAFAEYIAVNENRALAKKPDNVSFAQAAAVPVAALTALQALRDKGGIESGQKVLINGASGGVGTFAVQIAKSYGAEVTGVCSTRNVDMVRSIGADHVIDYKKDDFTKRAEQYDLVIDNVGNHPLSAYRDVLVPEGTLVVVGGPKGDWIGPLVNTLEAVLRSPFVDQTFATLMAKLRQADLELLGQLMARGQVVPVIDRHFPLRDIADAVRYSEDGHARGKIIVDVE